MTKSWLLVTALAAFAVLGSCEKKQDDAIGASMNKMPEARQTSEGNETLNGSGSSFQMPFQQIPKSRSTTVAVARAQAASSSPTRSSTSRVPTRHTAPGISRR